jgi:hypothetical protein
MYHALLMYSACAEYQLFANAVMSQNSGTAYVLLGLHGVENGQAFGNWNLLL